MGKFEHQLNVVEVGDKRYQSVEPLTKPSPAARGVYGGNLAGQALLVAIRSAGAGFTPNALHSYFVKPTESTKLVDWEVEEISNGKSFCNRAVRALQDGEIKYIANISLTRKNTVQSDWDRYNEYKRQVAEKAAAGEGGDVEDDDDEVVSKPFGFQTTFPEWLSKHEPESLPLDARSEARFIYHKVPPELDDLELTREEENQKVTDRRLAFYVKLGMPDATKLTDPAFQYVALGVLSDSLFLTRLARLMRIPKVNMKNLVHYFSLSLDHIMYIHDTDFDATEWMGFAFKAVRFSNRRVLLEAEIYNNKGVQVASIIQEGLVYMNGLEKDAKL